jgi:hypothetical protein
MHFIRIPSKAMLILALLTMCALFSHAQTTIANIDDLPISPSNDSNAEGQWIWLTGPDIGGCDVGCQAEGGIAQPADVTIDGQSIRFDVNNLNNGCTSDCWTDVLFFNRVDTTGNTDGATSFTLDTYATLNDTGNNVSQALEYTVEQDVCTQNCGTGSDIWTRFIYSMQCDYRGSGNWRVWDGNLNGGGGGWTDAYSSTPAPCVQFQPPSEYAHFVFHFTRPDLGHMRYVDFSVDNTHIDLQYLAGVQTTTNWQDQLVAEWQLDGDMLADSYSAWADQWTITYQ